MLVKVNKFIFPTCFIILYMKDRKVPLILGRPFFATGRAQNHVEEGKLTIRVNDEKIILKISLI